MNKLDYIKKASLHGTSFHKERISSYCVCCGSKSLKKSPAVLMPFIAHRAFGWEPAVIDESWGLKTIKLGNAYTVCNTLFCNECGFLFLDIRFSNYELESLYIGYREKEYTELRDRYEPGYIIRNKGLLSGISYLDDVEAFLKPMLNFPTRILDWGGDTGKNTPFKKNQCLFHIYDISNITPIQGAESVTKEKAYNTDYDVIICSNVLEHVPYPSELLIEMKLAMRKNTILYLEMPYEEIMRVAKDDSTIMTKKKHWHEHINFFSEKSIRNLIQLCGLKVVALRDLNAQGGGNSNHLFQVACQLI